MEPQTAIEPVSRMLHTAYTALAGTEIGAEERRLLSLGLLLLRQDTGTDDLRAAHTWDRIRTADPHYELVRVLADAIWRLREQAPMMEAAVRALDEVVERVRRAGGEYALREAVHAFEGPAVDQHAGERWPSGVTTFLEESGGAEAALVAVTPHDVVDLMVRLVDPRSDDRILDPACGTGAFLVRAFQLANAPERGLRLHGLERNRSSLAAAHLNLRLHGASDVSLLDTDALSTTFDTVRQFDCVVTAPPFAARWRPQFGGPGDPRFPFGLPPAHSADFAYLQHAAASLVPGGRGAVLLPPGVLFRGGEQGKIRRGMLQADLIEAVISLPRKLLYQYAGASVVVLLRSHKAPERRGQVLMVDASDDFEPRRSRNRLRPSDVSRVVETVQEFRDQPGKSRVASLDEIDAQGYDLNLGRWIENVVPRVEMDFDHEITELLRIEQERDACAAAIEELVARFRPWRE